MRKKLHIAAEAGDIETLKDCLAHGVAVDDIFHDDAADITDNLLYSHSALYLAAYEGHLEACKVLIEAGADVNFKREGDESTPLHAAASEGHLEVCRLLLDHGADVNAQQSEEGYSYTPLHAAARYGQAEVCTLLLERGADPTLRDSFNEETPAELAWSKGRDEAYDAITDFSKHDKKYDIIKTMLGNGEEVKVCYFSDGSEHVELYSSILTDIRVGRIPDPHKQLTGRATDDRFEFYYDGELVASVSYKKCYVISYHPFNPLCKRYVNGRFDVTAADSSTIFSIEA